MTVTTIQFHFDDIEEDTSKGFTTNNDQSVFAVKKDGQLYVYVNRCPHLGIELEWVEDRFLDSENAMIQCSTHGALFIIENGDCVSGPCAGDKLQSLPFSIAENGMVTVRLDSVI